MEVPKIYYVRSQEIKECLYNEIDRRVKEKVVKSISSEKNNLELINENRKVCYIKELIVKLQINIDLPDIRNIFFDFRLEENILKIHPDSVISTLDNYNDKNLNKVGYYDTEKRKYGSSDYNFTLLGLYDAEFCDESYNPIEIITELDIIEIFEKHFIKVYDTLSDIILLKFWKNELVNPNKKKQPTTNLKWYGAKSELIELTKALIENGTLKGKQEDIFNEVQRVFDIELKNIDQAITKFTFRKSSKTIFLDELKNSLNDYITNKAK